MFPVILLSRQIVLLSILSVFRVLLCGNSHSQLLILNLTFDTLWTRVGSGLVISMLEKLNLIDHPKKKRVVLLMLKWMDLS